MMNPVSSSSRNPTDHRVLLYERYVTLQVGADLEALRSMLASPQPYLERLIALHFPPDRKARILDVGCGYGLLLSTLQKAGYSNAVGIETSPEQMEMSRALGIEGVREGDATRVIAESESAYDVIVAFDVLEHFTKDEVLDLMTGIQRALRSGGRLILHVPNGEAIFAGKIFFGDFTHQTAFTPRSVSQIAGYAGFREVRCYEDKPTVHGLLSALRAMLWWFVRTRYRILNLIETGDIGKDLILSQNLLAVCHK